MTDAQPTTQARTGPDRDALRAGVAGARVTVVGGARSGLAAARLLARHGAGVFLTERGEANGLAEALRQAGVAFETGGHTARALDADWLVVSPGVPTSAPIVQSALRLRLPVFSEVEVASWFARGPVVAITGSNGKTTTTSLVGHLFKTAGRAHVVAGNIGYAFADYADDVDEATAVVLEVSSFQLDHVATFRPRVSVLLNVTPDHLDRYDHSVELYAAAKYRVFENAGPGDWLVYNHDDAAVRAAAEAHGAATPGVVLAPFSIETRLPVGAFVRPGPDGAEHVVLALPDPSALRDGAPTSPPNVIRTESFMPTADLALPGRHNLYNSLAAAIVARAMEIRSDVVRESLTSFEGVPHRLETVRTLGGVTYVNDSKATNVNAVWYALESFPGPPQGGRVVLIAGGKDKGNDYDPLKPLVAAKVAGVVAIGESAETVERELGPHAPRTVTASTMEEAIQFARLMAEPGDTVLLSPACASFDMFENYEDRGDTFKRLVHALA
ncbi:MAG TPA: UDP-N-acetylmuramoyl-L-alanine--D-glutamate ligase [Rubricoccaceae bacterium]